MQTIIIDKFSYLVGIFTFFIGLVLFYQDTGLFWGSFAAAVLTGMLCWVSYVLTRWLVLAIWK